MKTILYLIATCVFSLPAFGLAENGTLPTKSDSIAENPNFIVFLTDDQGWGDLGCYGHPVIKSPNLDKFATEGVRLTQCYSACSVCSPSRSSILTGRTPYRNGVFRWIPGGSQYHLRESEITIAEILKERGYETCHVGKWHLNGKFNSPDQPQPNDHGYDHWMATQNNASPNHMNPENFVRNGTPVGKLEGPSAVLCAEEAIRWMESRKDSPKPFFLTVWTHEPHLPIESAEEFMKPYANLKDPNLRQHHGNITQLDAAFGKLMTAVDAMGLRDNTFVLFTSDNGPEGNGDKGRTRGSTGGLRGRKRHTHEGGIRVPGIVRWPGKIKPGTESSTPVVGSDIFSTICEIVGAPIPTDRTIDGASMVPMFSGNPINRAQPMYWRNHLASENTQVAMRDGDWKIIGSKDLSKFELYNIKDDWQETKDLQTTHVEQFNALKQKLITFDAAVLAEGPDWWKDDVVKKKKSKKKSDPNLGKDETGKFQKVFGANVTKSDFGYRVDASGGEGLVLRRLEKGIMGTGTIKASFQSAQAKGKTRNAMLVIGCRPTNSQTIKFGTAVGMNSHVAFQGDWSNVGSLAKQKAKFEPMDKFDVVVDVDIKNHTANVTINGETMKVDLPKSLDRVTWVGYYAKQTTSDFSEIEIESK